MKPIIRSLLLGFALAVSAPGCVSSYSTSASWHTPLSGPAEHGQRKTLNIESEFQVVGVIASNDQRQSAVDHINAWAEDIFKRSGRYDVTHNKMTADYRLLLHVRDTGKPHRALAILCGFTLLVVPAVASDNYETEVNLVKKDGTVIARRTLSSRVTMVMEILLLPATPFATLPSVERKMWREVLTEVFAWTDEQLKAAQP